MTKPPQRAWLEIDPSAVSANARSIKQLIGRDCDLMAVVKADGYGHGAETVARAALDGGASELGVATLQEGIELRKSGLRVPILVLGNIFHSAELDDCMNWDLMPTISNYEEVSLCESLAIRANKEFKVQVKVDTGMTRLGCKVEDFPGIIKEIINSRNISLKGVYSHLAMADRFTKNDLGDVTSSQVNLFENVLDILGPVSKKVCCHLANSAGTLRDKSLHYNMVRVGLALYGYSPLINTQIDLSLKPALSVKARVALIREVPAGVGVSYGHTFITKRPSRLAVVGIGYADGVPRTLSGKMKVLINGKLVSQVGSITMDQLILDVTDIDSVQVGSVVTLLGQDCHRLVSPKDWCDTTGSILWEVICGFKNRLPRILI